MTVTAATTVTPTDFDEYFRAVNGGHAPFSWQTRLFESVLDTGRWPDRVAAPTGAGKSSVVDIHVFLNALHGAGSGPRVPRRLSVVVNRRGLVDNHADRAAAIANRITNADADTDRLLVAVREGLLALRALPVADATTLTADDILPLTLLRGGLAPDSSWLDDPTRCSVICATPDMWGSRLLFRGYGSTRYARPREAGLLVYDSVMVLDEAHLNRQLLVSARRIADLERRAPQQIGVPCLQVVETTATPGRELDDGQREIGVSVDDLVSGDGTGIDDGRQVADQALAARLTRAKPVTFVQTSHWPGARRPGKAYCDELATLTLEQHKRLGTAGRYGRTVGCVVNTVDTALAVAQRLRMNGLSVQTLVGRMRRFDSDRLKSDHAGLFSPEGDKGVDVLVATQTLEVGFDADLAALVTELAPGAALAQRAGRVNRLGRQESTEVVVVGPELDLPVPDRVGPYAGADLEAAAVWLERRIRSAEGLSPWGLVSDPPPEESLGRTLLQRPELWNAWAWARSSDDLVSDSDLALWLRDSLEADRATAGLVVRAGLPDDDAEAIGLLRETVPVEAEVFPCTLGVVRRRLGVVLGTDTCGEDAPPRAFVYRNGDIAIWTEGDHVRPGDVFVIDAAHPVVREHVVVDGESEPATDVYSECTGGDVEVIVFDRDRPDEQQLLREAAELSPIETVELLRALRGDVPDCEVHLGPVSSHPDAQGALAWIVVRRTTVEVNNEDVRQEWTPARSQVTLCSHNAAVAERAGMIAEALGLPDSLTQAVSLAGLHHDDGKADPRFQRLLGAGDVVLAKSATRSAQRLRAARMSSGLPTGWRHEQLSVVLASAEVGTSLHADLVLRLVGTSHGRGRSGFPHTGSELLDGVSDVTAVAVDLFDEGRWDTLIETTHAQWGVWGAAYLESILRSADSQISKEGR